MTRTFEECFVDIILGILKDQGLDLSKDARILDFGCGAGKCMEALKNKGYHNVYGFDIIDYLDDESDRERFFPDIESLMKHKGSFDFIYSNQVLEHVMNYPEVISQLYQLQKNNSVSLHIFPSRHNPIEPHIKVPFATIIQSKWYLYLWALLGIRHQYQKGLSAQEACDRNYKFLKTRTNYLSRSNIRQLFKNKFSDAKFVDSSYLKMSPGKAKYLPNFVKKSKLAAFLIGQFWASAFITYKRDIT